MGIFDNNEKYRDKLKEANEAMKNAIDKKYGGDYEKYIGQAKKEGHLYSAIGVFALIFSIYFLTGFGWLAWLVGIIGGVSILIGLLSFSTVNTVRKLYENED